MKIVQINPYYGNGSTGQICYSLSHKLSSRGIDNYVLYTQGGNKSDSNGVYYGYGLLYSRMQSVFARILGNNGFNNKLITYDLLKRLDKIQPDIVHLHNLHAQNVNLEELFNYLYVHNTQVVITMHDCWLFTGYCHHFDMIGCEGWLNNCPKCPYYKQYSSFRNRSHKNCTLKKEAISKVKPTIVTPSNWMKGIVEKSGVVNRRIEVIHNGIDLNCFYPRRGDKRSDTYTILGVADRWDQKKGIDVVNALAKKLPSEYEIVIVGTNQDTDKRLDHRIKSIHRTENREQLAELYSDADVFINPTREEVLGLVNIEALACGTPVITFNTGGSPECIDQSCGMVIDKNDVDGMRSGIIQVCSKRLYRMEDCVQRAKMFSANKMIDSYLQLYLDLE